MKKLLLVLISFHIFLLTGLLPGFSLNKSILIGDIEKTYILRPDDTQIRGLTFDDSSKKEPLLYIIDLSKKILIYRLNNEKDTLEFLSSISLPRRPDGTEIENPRGLALSMEDGQKIFYFLNWYKSKQGVKSELWRFNSNNNSAVAIDLSLYLYGIGEREVLSLAFKNGKFLISFDGSGYKDQNIRVQRGIIQLQWNYAAGEQCKFIKHVPDSGIAPSHGLAFMELDGANYLWATVGNEHVYVAEASTGRGIFHFPFFPYQENKGAIFGLAFGESSLWIPESIDGADRLHRINVIKNLDSPRLGHPILRHLIMTISTEPEKGILNPGKVYHYYSRPYPNELMGNQGIWLDSERFQDTSKAINAKLKIETYDPANDKYYRQYFALVEYENAPPQIYSSRYEIDIWTRYYRKYVYPHRADNNTDQLKGTNYLSDDPVLYNLKDTKTYTQFLGRVKEHIKKKYGVEADFTNPYWAARNVLEYIQDNYYYPSRPKRKPATVDYNRKHYDANPANLKLELSNKEYDKTQIIACSGTSVMLTAVMRYLGFPARWLGTATEMEAERWDKDGDGILDDDETAPCSNGHRYTQVWLGSTYGWICFDATPTLPDNLDYDIAPPLQSQWQYMNRAAAGHLKNKRIVFNVGSELISQLYRDFEYDENLAADNNCGGDQRYNLQGRFEKPELWKLAKHSISVRNMCFIKDISLTGPKNEKEIRWTLLGQWEKDPEARLSFYLQRFDPSTGHVKDIAVLKSGVPFNAKVTKVNLSGYEGKQFRIIIRKDGDEETGGTSDWFDLE